MMTTLLNDTTFLPWTVALVTVLVVFSVNRLSNAKKIKSEADEQRKLARLEREGPPFVVGSKVVFIDPSFSLAAFGKPFLIAEAVLGLSLDSWDEGKPHWYYRLSKLDGSPGFSDLRRTYQIMDFNKFVDSVKGTI